METITSALFTGFLALIGGLIALAVGKPALYIRAISSVVGWALGVTTLLILGAGIGANLGVGEWMFWASGGLVLTALLWVGLMFLAVHMLSHGKDGRASKPAGNKDQGE